MYVIVFNNNKKFYYYYYYYYYKTIKNKLYINVTLFLMLLQYLLYNNPFNAH